MYGTQTKTSDSTITGAFENDVKMYGTQTITLKSLRWTTFENDVKMYGTQTQRRRNMTLLCLRMM